MFLPFPRVLPLVACVFVVSASSIPSRAQIQDQTELRVCADPNNLPFSNEKQEGFENRIAQFVAQDLHARVTYIWQRMGRGFVRDYLNTRRCDVLIGIPTDFRPVLTTTPYYRSTYVFVVRRDAAYKPFSLDDDRLRSLKIGVQALDEQYSPPAEALMHRGMQDSLVPYHTVGEDAGTIVQAVVDKQVDAAIVWGPLAGYWTHKLGDVLECIPVQPESEPPGFPFTFEISMGVRKGDDALRHQLEDVLHRRREDINKILTEYGVPQLDHSTKAPKGVS
jgi:quinoprotein dehydrogenase-associated probable ABC transporter substrate-binding protein